MTMDGTRVFEKMIEALRWVAGEDDNCPTSLDESVHAAMLWKVARALRAAGQPSKDAEDAVRRVLARTFIGHIRTWLTTEELTIAISRNGDETDPRICHTQDFCDANMAMQSAFEDVQIPAPVEMEDGTDEHEATCDLWNEAWKLAKAAEFNAEKLNP
jgi:hypothetical protein